MFNGKLHIGPKAHMPQATSPSSSRQIIPAKYKLTLHARAIFEGERNRKRRAIAVRAEIEIKNERERKEAG